MTQIPGKTVVLLLILSSLSVALAQTSQSPITNADVISMAKAGIGDQTIILTIQRGPTNLDTSPQALILLKKAGLSDQVLNAVLSSANQRVTEPQEKPEAAAAPNIPPKQNNPSLDAQALFQKALDSIGAKDKILSIQSIRSKADVVQTSEGSSYSLERELTRVFPDSAVRVDTTAGRNEMEVITHEFGYKTRGDTKTPISRADLVTIQQFLKLDPINIAQHSQDFSIKFACKAIPEGTTCDQIRLTDIISATSVLWTIDLESGRLLSIRTEKPLPEQQTDLSDYRAVNGIYRPFRTVTTSASQRTETSIVQYDINPSIDASLFAKPNYPTATPTNPQPASVATIPPGPTGLAFRVLQSQSVPYVQESGGGISTTCNIVGNSNTSVYANSIGSSAYGTATTNWNQRMNCNSYDTTMRWPHVLNVMFVRASDGNSYIIGCDRAWRWSKCVPLRAGDTFNAHLSEKGIEVEAQNSKGKEERPTYHILQSAASQ